MPEIDIRVDGQGGNWKEHFRDHDVAQMNPDVPIRIETLDHGMKSGEPSVMILLDIGHGIVVAAQTSVKLFQMAAYTTMAKYGDKTQGAISGLLSEGGTAHLTLSAAAKCPNPVCSTEQPGSNKFCSECGVKL